jgi:hypothetical protein
VRVRRGRRAKLPMGGRKSGGEGCGLWNEKGGGGVIMVPIVRTSWSLRKTEW